MEVAALRFQEGDTLIRAIRIKYETRLSTTMRSWTVPTSQFHLNGFMKLIVSMAWIEFTGLKTAGFKETPANSESIIAEKRISTPDDIQKKMKELKCVFYKQ